MRQRVIRISFADEQEMDRKLVAIMEKRGFRVERLEPAQLTVSQLARVVKRNFKSVSRSLHRISCPPFDCVKGKKRILKLTPNPRLLAYLKL